MADDVEFYDYSSYIESDAWKERARHIRERDGYRCQICGANDVPLEVHHLTYDRIGHERDDDLITLCRACHEAVTDSWDGLRDDIKARRKFTRKLLPSYDRAREIAHYLNVLMPHDITFGGKHVLTGTDNIRIACKDAGIQYKHAMAINNVFSPIHVIDVVTQINSGVPRWKLVSIGYPKSLVNDIAKRKEKTYEHIRDVSDQLICYMHDGNGKWIVTAIEDGFDSVFMVRFMPYLRYECAWWDDE